MALDGGGRFGVLSGCSCGFPAGKLGLGMGTSCVDRRWNAPGDSALRCFFGMVQEKKTIIFGIFCAGISCIVKQKEYKAV